MSGDHLDLDQLLYDAEQGYALSTEARQALAAEVRRLREERDSYRRSYLELHEATTDTRR